jgi:hypothetical protein
MTHLENELRAALARRDPPDGFADRVMARVPRHAGRKTWIPSPWMAAAAALLVAMLGGGAYEYRRAAELRADGERAKSELVFALGLASEKLQSTKTKVLKHGESRI